MKKLFLITVLLLLSFTTISATTEYTVDETGITLPRELQAHDHVNVRFEYAEDGDVKSFTRNIHLDPNNGHPGGALQGALELNWSDWNKYATPDNQIPYDVKLCVAWVQVAGYNYHYGENGESVKNQPCFEIEKPEIPDTELPETGLGDNRMLPIVILLAGTGIYIIGMKFELRKMIKGSKQ